MTFKLSNPNMRFRIAAVAIAVIILAFALAYRIMGTQAGSIVAQANAQPQVAANATSSDALVPQTISGTSSATDALATTLLQQYLVATKGGTVPLNNPDALGTAIANSIQVEAPAYRIYTDADITTTTNTSAHMNANRTAIAAALAPMRTNKDPELGVYSRAVAGDASAKTELQQIIDAYVAADTAAAAVPVPQGAFTLHLAAINALSHYAASLAALLAHIDDPTASIILLRDYNDAEQEMFDSFGALQGYLATPTT